MGHKILRLRMTRKGDDVTIDGLGASPRGTPFIVKTVKGKAPRADKQLRKSEMLRLVEELANRTE